MNDEVDKVPRTSTRTGGASSCAGTWSGSSRKELLLLLYQNTALDSLETNDEKKFKVLGLEF